MKTTIRGARIPRSKLERTHRIYDTCYGESEKNRLADKARNDGHEDVRAYKETTDTPGLKMYTIWVKDGD
jgi:hypothetical protein